MVQSLWEPGWVVSGWERLRNVQACVESIGLLMALKGRDSRGKQSKIPHFNMCHTSRQVSKEDKIMNTLAIVI